jgi:thioredoxin 1
MMCPFGDEDVQVFVDFFAEWCGPCKMVAPKIDALSQEYPGIVFVKIDVDQAPVRPCSTAWCC